MLEPEQGQRRVGGAALALSQHHTEAVLGHHHTVFRRLLIPGARSRQILPHIRIVPVVIAQAQHGRRRTGLRRLRAQGQAARDILLDELAANIQFASGAVRVRDA